MTPKIKIEKSACQGMVWGEQTRIAQSLDGRQADEVSRNGTTSEAFSRFSGDRGKILIAEALKDQKVVQGDAQLAEEVCAQGTLIHYAEGEFLTREGDWSNDIMFILAGKAQIIITGFKVAERHAGCHIGEMALIDPTQPRSASAIAMEDTVCLLLSEEKFSRVASRYPNLWRQFAKEIAHRLRQRKKFIRPSNSVPIVFIACSTEALPIAEAVKAQLASSEVIVEIWTDGIFKPSMGTMESLEKKLEQIDFAIAIFSADDKVESRGEQRLAPRDNTVFELGLFAGAIGRDRSFFVVQKQEGIKIPSDLAGITSLRFDMSAEDNLMPNVLQACEQIKERISALGVR